MSRYLAPVDYKIPQLVLLTNIDDLVLIERLSLFALKRCITYDFNEFSVCVIQ